jgi:eukaryotic-like serine/threonine-protein kinase
MANKVQSDVDVAAPTPRPPASVAIHENSDCAVTHETGPIPPFRALLKTSKAGEEANQDAPHLTRRDVDGRPTATTSAPAAPGYEIVAELGRGGMGVVYLARHGPLKRLVALKMIVAGLHADAKARGRFRTEAEACARLQHANIVQVYEVGECDGRPFLAMEHIAGGSLAQQAGSVWPERDAARMVETLARAVQYMHERGILHRDLKPNNILLTADGVPKIVDFGLAKLLDAEEGQTRSEALLGTPSYMAPEQAAGNAKNVAAPADIYSLGAILYELLTGRVPFQGPNPLSTLEQVRSQPPVPPRRFSRAVSLDLDTICLKCLEKSPQQRYPSAAALADDLRRFQEGQSIQARPLPAWQRLWRSGRRHPARVAAGLSAAILAALLCVGWLYDKEVTRRRAEDRYEKFVQCRNDAFVHGLLARDDGALFVGAASDNLQKADLAARDALDLAGVEIATSSEPAMPLPSARRAEATADCYALLLMLASVRAQQAPTGDERRAARQQALAMLDRASELGIETKAYHSRRAGLLEQLGEVAEAGEERKRAESARLAGALDHFLLGDEQYRRGDWKKAMNSFNRALRLEPEHFWARFFLAVCHMKAEQWEAARASLNACLAQKRDFAWALVFRSFANEKLLAHAEAHEDLETVLRRNPNDDMRAIVLLRRGALHFNQKEWGAAESDFQDALKRKPDRYNAHLSLATVHLARREFEQAEQDFSNALGLKPPDRVVFDYYVARGRGLVLAGENKAALQACTAALEVLPNEPAALAVRGRALLQLERFEDAEQSYSEYLARGGEVTPEVFRGRGQARSRNGKYLEAVDDFGWALDREPHAQDYLRRGWAYFFADASRFALRDFAKSIELGLETSEVYTGRGLAQTALGNYRGGVADARMALQSGPTTPEMMHNVACIFAQAAALAQSREPDQPTAAVYRSQAVEAVVKTLEMLRPEERLAFWHDKVLPDRALRAIHNEPGFKQLVEQYR